GQKLPFSLSDIRLDEAKQTEIDQARKVIYQEVLQKYPPASEDEALIVGIKHLEETRDDGVPSSLSLEDKALLEHHSLIDLAILSLAYPLYQETTLQNSPSSQEAEKAAEKAWVMITERFEKDPILSRYQDAIFLEVIRDPIETVLANGQSAYHDKSSEEALEVGKKDPSMHVPIQEIKEAPHVKAYLTKRKEQICQELVLYKRSEIKEAVKEEKLVEAVSNIQIVPTQPVSLGKFFKAAGNGDLKTIQEGLNQGLSINAKDNDGKTVLILAAENGKLNIVQYLVGDERVDLDAKDNDGRTALMLAEENGKLDIVQYLEGFTASLKKFFEAAGNGDLKTIQEGLNQRVPINAKGYYCRTALMLAAENGKLDIVQYLAEKDGIDLNAKDALGSTALMLAVENGLDIVRYLAEKDGIDLNAKNKSGLTVLMLAAAGGHLDVVQYLAEKDGIDLNAKRKDGLTVLMLAAGEGHLDVVQYLAGKEGVDLNAKSEYDMTALTLAARFGHLDVVQYLAGKEGVDLNEKDRYGLTVLMLAAAGGHLDVVQYLAGKEGVDLNAKSEDGMTARDFAEANGHYEIAEHLAARNTVRP
ncbi:MAG: hypothetical protein FJZ58_06250, partial [Chlamydiae bacterium]|nr:hypothetical protein [Chlamydiota bacterium]